jgi:copper chaperone CopZ
VAIKKIEGVDTVKVSLNQGLAEITFKPGNRATLEQVREIVRRNGFTPKAADIRVAGTIVRHAGKPALAVTGTDIVYRLAEHPDAKGRVTELNRSAGDQAVVVAGQVPESTPGTEGPLALQVREFSLPAR